MQDQRNVVSLCLKVPLAIAAIVLSGCVSDRDIGNDLQYPSDFVENTIYYTKVPLVLAVYHGAIPASTAIVGVQESNSLLPPDQPHFFGPHKTYELLPVGSQIRVGRIHRFNATVDVGSMEIIDAKLASGPHAGTDVNIDVICRTKPSPTLDRGLLVRNPDILSASPPKS